MKQFQQQEFMIGIRQRERADLVENYVGIQEELMQMGGNVQRVDINIKTMEKTQQ